MENQNAVTVEKFARVYEMHGRQFLVRKGKDNEDNPKLCIITMIDGAEIDFGFCFPDNPEGWEALDHAFEKEKEIADVVDAYGKRIAHCKTAMEVALSLNS